MTSVILPAAQAPLILVSDIGSSSLRAMLVDAQAREIAGTRVWCTYTVRVTDDGGTVRVVPPHAQAFQIPYGFWLDCVDERRGLSGGSLNKGGMSISMRGP